MGTLLGGFYLLVTFARPGILNEKQLWILAFIGVIILGLIVIRMLERLVYGNKRDVHFGQVFYGKIVSQVNRCVAA